MNSRVLIAAFAIGLLAANVAPAGDAGGEKKQMIQAEASRLIEEHHSVLEMAAGLQACGKGDAATRMMYPDAEVLRIAREWAAAKLPAAYADQEAVNALAIALYTHYGTEQQKAYAVLADSDINDGDQFCADVANRAREFFKTNKMEAWEIKSLGLE